MWLEKLQGHIRLARNPQNLNLPAKEQKCHFMMKTIILEMCY